MMDRFSNAPALRRAAALSILALLVWLAAPLVLSPFAGFSERAEAIASEAQLVDRLDRLAARRASVAALAAEAVPPFIVAADSGSALSALQTRLVGIVAPDKLRIDGVSALPIEEKPGAPVAVQVSFSATESGLYAFLSDLETRPPFVRVRELSVKSSADESGHQVIDGTAVLSAVPFLQAQP